MSRHAPSRPCRAAPLPAGLGGLLLGALLAAPVCAQLFSDQTVRYISADPERNHNVKVCEEGASVKMQYLYHMFRKEGAIRDCEELESGQPWCSCKPPWLAKMLPEMFRKAVWQDPNEGVLSEAAIWQGPVSVLYEFFTILQKTFPPEQDGAGIPPIQLRREFADNATRFKMSVDRLKRARLGGSMEGRGRSLIADFDLIAHEYESFMDGLIRSDAAAFGMSAVAIARLTHMSYAQFFLPPRGLPPFDAFLAKNKLTAEEFKALDLAKKQRLKEAYWRGGREPPSQGGGMRMIATMGSIFLVFMAGLQFGVLNKDLLDKKMEQYGERSRDWSKEFSRQFVAIKVHYLVLGPWIGMTLLGVLTGKPLLVLALSMMGLYAGLHLPAFMIDFIRRQRGQQVEAQLIDALTLLGNALKSGLDLVGGFRLVEKELLPPISEEFGLVLKNFDLGQPFGKALEGLEDRVESTLVSYMVKAVVIQQQVGGNIIKIFDRIIENIRQEAKLAEKIGALTAQQRIQSIVVGIMPWVMVGVLFLFQKKQMSEFYGSPLGFFILIGCAIWIAIGMKVVAKMGDIQV